MKWQIEAKLTNGRTEQFEIEPDNAWTLDFEIEDHLGVHFDDIDQMTAEPLDAEAMFHGEVCDIARIWVDDLAPQDEVASQYEDGWVRRREAAKPLIEFYRDLIWDEHERAQRGEDSERGLRGMCISDENDNEIMMTREQYRQELRERDSQGDGRATERVP